MTSIKMFASFTYFLQAKVLPNGETMWSIVDAETGLPPNQTLFGPRNDLDMFHHSEEMEKLIELLHPVIKYIEEAVSEFLLNIVPLFTTQFR